MKQKQSEGQEKEEKICDRKPRGLFKDKLTVSELTIEIFHKWKCWNCTASYKLYSVECTSLSHCQDST